jgi:hypothetical protein
VIVVEIKARFHAVDVRRLTQECQAAGNPVSVFVPANPEAAPGPGLYYALDFDASGGYLWSLTLDADGGVRVPINRVRPSDGAGVAAMISLAWRAREELFDQTKKRSTEEIGIVFDPSDTADEIHFGIFAKVR